ncbi:MAG: hypothetical protein ACSLFE_02005 [Gemmatimonadaceae bacterium]
MQAAPTQRTIDREQLREQIRQTIEDATAAQNEAGRVTVIAPAAPGIATTAQAPPWIPPDDIPPRVQETAFAFFITFAVMIIGYPIAKAIGRRIDRTGAAPKVPPAVASQLAQLNQAVEAIAVEVERISEGQRFTTKLLSEQHKLPAASREIS